MIHIPQLKDIVLRDTPFTDLMNKRIYNILLIATKYDAFMLEDDGRVDEQIFNEYTNLGLRYPPRFTQVTTKEEALEKLNELNFELIIVMPNMDNRDIFADAKEIKQNFPIIPIVVLTPFSKEVSKRVAHEDLSSIDYVFSWLGDPELLVAIVKLIEDKWNAPTDCDSVGVQVILLVEDSIRFYSSALTHLFKFVLEQSLVFAQEALNDHLRTLRMRGRPKVMLARNYEEAVMLFHQYQDHILGIVSDMSFPKDGKKDALAGYKLGQYVRSIDRHIPLIYESSESNNAQYAQSLEAAFIKKTSKAYPQELRREVMAGFGFGDFVIVNPKNGNEIMRIRTLKDLQNNIFAIPDDSMRYHLARNHFSRFFFSRAMFPPAVILKGVEVTEYTDMMQARQLIFDLIMSYRRLKNEGVVAIYRRDMFDQYSHFARIGRGSLGGKGRGLAFMGSIAKRHPSLSQPNFAVGIPTTVVVCTDIFDEFMENNNLYPVALSNATDEEILKAFLNASLPREILDDLSSFLKVVHGPIAVRSSSILEDSHYQPFAGVYATYMVPLAVNEEDTLNALRNAIKAVYASVFYHDSKTYLTATQNLIDQEKMAVVLQEVVGSPHNGRYYPLLSGVARSLNFYPIESQRTEDGIASVALGLGKYIVDGGKTLRFSPAQPRHILQLSNPATALRETQQQFYALDLKTLEQSSFRTNEDFNLLTLPISEAETDGMLPLVASTYDVQNDRLLPGTNECGRRVLTFAGILEYEGLPLAKTLSQILHIGAQEMGRPIEIEFALNKNPQNQIYTFYLLQIRPIVAAKERVDEDLTKIDASDTILQSSQVLGNGIMNDIFDVVYVKTAGYDAADNKLIAAEVAEINEKLLHEDRGYILVGPGRWGSSDPWLGIPVKWAHISGARVIAECSLDNYRIDPSQGSHFFQNLTSFGAGYFTVNRFAGEGLFDEDYLNAQPAIHETDHVRHVRFEKPLVVKIDGRRAVGVVLK